MGRRTPISPKKETKVPNLRAATVCSGSFFFVERGKPLKQRVFFFLFDKLLGEPRHEKAHVKRFLKPVNVLIIHRLFIYVFHSEHEMGNLNFCCCCCSSEILDSESDSIILPGCLLLLPLAFHHGAVSSAFIHMCITPRPCWRHVFMRETSSPAVVISVRTRTRRSKK